MNDIYDAIVIHSGTPHEGNTPHSGRYPWGSGENAFQHDDSFIATCVKIRREVKGVTNAQIAELMGMTKKEYYQQMATEIKHYKGITESKLAETFGIKTPELRAVKSIIKNMQLSENIQEAIRLRDSTDPPMSNSEIGRRMGTNESNVRNWLKEGALASADKTRILADSLARQVEDKKAIDIGVGVELELNTTETRLKNATALLKEEGYNIYNLKTAQLTNPGRYTTIKVLADKDVTFSDIRDMQKNATIGSVGEYAVDNGKTFCNLYEPESIDASRVYIRYGDEGGREKDGTIELRRGVEDISIGNLNYTQARIVVKDENGKTGFMKGMALYRDDIPKGYDIVYNTRKSEDVPVFKEDGAVDSILKGLKKDKDNPFGATIKMDGQRFYEDDDGNYVKEGNLFVKDNGNKSDSQHYKLSVINRVNDEGDWEEWSKTLSSQFLSKQNKPLIEKQLELAYWNKQDEFDDYKQITNPTIKARILQGFADDCDSAAVDLKAASLPRQSFQVILPINSLKDNEIYAPNYRDGETVVLIRHPHAGTFEIPQLTVNNRNKEGASVITPNAKDAVGINASVAVWLSGADFDGDTALVIPANNGANSPKIKTEKRLKGLIDFDPESEYPYYDGMKVLTKEKKGLEMGKITNLITDMTLFGAPQEEVERAVKHSMVVIDAEKHKLDYLKSYEDNKIAELKIKYQGGEKKGAATIISKASSEKRVDQRRIGYSIDKTTGEKIYFETGSTYVDEKGKTKTRQEKSTKMAEAKDAYDLVSPFRDQTELLYAEYANKMKRMGDQARREVLLANQTATRVSSTAKQAYADEIDSLNKSLTTALKNAPRERQAAIAANSIVSKKIKDNPDMDKAEKKKLKAQVLAGTRLAFGSSKKAVNVKISDKEWEAIQNNAISATTLKKLMNNTDLDELKKRAVPKATTTLSITKINLIKSMANSNYTNAAIADRLGISTATVSKYLK